MPTIRELIETLKQLPLDDEYVITEGYGREENALGTVTHYRSYSIRRYDPAVAERISDPYGYEIDIYPQITEYDE